MELCLNGITVDIRFSESPSLETSESAHPDPVHSLLPKLTLSIASTLSTHEVLMVSEKVNYLWPFLFHCHLSSLVDSLVSTEFPKDHSYHQGARGRVPAQRAAASGKLPSCPHGFGGAPCLPCCLHTHHDGLALSQSQPQ